jgi:hypothetical protein
LRDVHLGRIHDVALDLAEDDRQPLVARDSTSST